jgi:hypothetical protein
MKIESTLSKIAESVFSATDLQTAQNRFIQHVSETKVKDKEKMISVVKELKTVQAVHRYTANALLAYEGLRTS